VHVAIASDHAGYALKQDLVRYLAEHHVTFDDFGTTSDATTDYPDFAAAVGRAIVEGRADRGILICGTGIGMSIAANKIAGIRAALVTDVETARLSREHNDANIIALGGRTTSPVVARAIVDVFLTATFAGGRHAHRVEKIARLETCPDETRTDSL
jgi:RpiB/LacA/LacB family sugar-phosphate isomerase